MAMLNFGGVYHVHHFSLKTFLRHLQLRMFDSCIKDKPLWQSEDRRLKNERRAALFAPVFRSLEELAIQTGFCL